MFKIYWVFVCIFFVFSSCRSGDAKEVNLYPCSLDINSELAQSVKSLDALRFEYSREDLDPRKVFLVAVASNNLGKAQIQDLGLKDVMHTSTDVDCMLIPSESKIYAAMPVSIEHNLQHVRSVKKRTGVNPDTVMVLALMDSTRNLRRIYFGGGQHTVRVVDFD